MGINLFELKIVFGLVTILEQFWISVLHLEWDNGEKEGCLFHLEWDGGYWKFDLFFLRNLYYKWFVFNKGK